MKRSSDDDVFVSSSSQHKRPAISSRVEPSRPAHRSTATSAQRLTTSDALTYLKTVKEVFQDKKEMYDEFLEVMKDFKAQRVDTSGVIARVKELFKGRRDLILGFNTFLPKGYEITLPPEDEAFLKKKPVEFEEAISFVNTIKIRFQGDDRVYRAFLDILNMYRKDNKSISEVYQEVSVLFQDHADLLVEFTHFLPDTTGTASIHHSQLGKNQFLPGDDKGHSLTMARSLHIEKKPAVSYALHVNCDNSDREQQKRLDKVEKREDKENSDWDHHDGLDHKRKSAGGDDSLTGQFGRGTQDPMSTFCEKVKEKLQDSGNYEKFLDCVRSYQRKFVTASQFRKLVANLLGTYPDLMEESEAFITFIEKTGWLHSNRQHYRSPKVDQDDDNIDREDNENNIHDFRERDRYNRGLTSNNKDIMGLRTSPYPSKDKFSAKPIHELNLSNCNSCTPSYRLLPENYPIPIASRRTKIGAKVLNDHWVSVTSGSEDYSFKHMRKNQYEESLFRCEDDRFELDMLLESVSATANRVEELLDSLNSQINKTESSFCIEDHLTALDVRCIERLYGDHGLDVIDVLRKNAPLALPVILTRLKQKQEEWARCRADFNKVWAEIYSKNYHKSLDHRSFYFKQQDAKNLSTKALLTEIKDISEKNESVDETVLSIGGGYKQPIRPHMDFRYADPDIHEDLYQLMNYASGEVCTPEQHDKVMKIWKNFLETLLDLPPHPKSVDEKLKSNNDVDVVNVEGKGSFSSEEVLENPTSGDLSKIGDETDAAENYSPDGVKMSHCNNGTDNECFSAVSKTYPTEKDMLHDGSGNILMQTDGSITSAKSWASREQGTSSMAGACSIHEKNDSDSTNGPEFFNANCRIGAMPGQEAQRDGVEPISSSIGTLAEQVKIQTRLEENDGLSDGGQEEGELSPNQNLGISVPIVQNPRASAPTTMQIEGEEIDTNADEEGEDSVQGSLECENASENDDLSVSDSANIEEFREAPDEDGVHDETNKVGDEGEADHMADVDNITMSNADRLLQTVKPLTIKIPATLHGKQQNSHIFYANDSFYLLFRLHQMLYERMQSAKLHSTSIENKWRASNSSVTSNAYVRFKEALHSLLDGSFDHAKFEDECRAIIGAQSYVLFTLDKLIHKLVKQLQAIATEDVENKLLLLYVYERSRKPENFVEAIYHENARFLLPDDNLYRIECFPFSPMRLTIQLMKNEHYSHEPAAVLMDPDFATYLHSNLLSVDPERTRPGVFLKRNKRKFSAGDEVEYMMEAMEGVIIHNGVEIKLNTKTMKAAYVLGTEDFFYRTKKRRKDLYSTSNGCTKRRKLMIGIE